MSHVAQCSVVIRDLDDLESAVKRLGGTLKRGQKRANWYGNFMDDSTEWKTLFSEEEAKLIANLPRAERIRRIETEMSRCDHAIKFPLINYEIGVVAQDDGTFRLRFDSFDYALTQKVGGGNAGLLSQAYALEAGARAARLQGWMSREVTESDGAVRLQVVVS